MNETELFRKTIDRLHRVGCRTDEERIIYLAEEIEYYRARIEHLLHATPPEHIDPARDQVMQFAAAAYTPDIPGTLTALPKEETTRRAHKEIAAHLIMALAANGAIELQERKQQYFPYITEYIGRIRVVMPNKEEPQNGV